MKYFLISVCSFVVLLSTGCKKKTDYRALENFSNTQLIQWNKKLTQIIISDVFSPPVCSRIYAYCNIAAYEALVPANSSHKSFSGRLNNLEEPPRPNNKTDSCYLPISSVIAFTTVARKLLFNTEAMKEMETKYLAQLDSLPVSKAIIDSSVNYGRAVGNHILAWAAKDGYAQRNANPAYIVTSEPYRWQPTPPDYIDAIEPNWGTLRPFVLDSASLFRHPSPLKFDTSKNSGYYKEAMIVYNSVNNLTHDDTSIAKFWDCNPNVSITSGHITYFQQLISPGGHWIYIAASAVEKEKPDMIKTAEVMSKVSISMADAFISCWEAKFVYNTVRPETYINRYIDKDWKPFIQTPPFPEYPSGHSTISGSAAATLTSLFGENYSFIDSAEVPFGRAPKHFNSFAEAAQQASISRLYGGIHYLVSLNLSAEAGKKIAEYINMKLNQ